MSADDISDVEAAATQRHGAKRRAPGSNAATTRSRRGKSVKPKLNLSQALHLRCTSEDKGIDDFNDWGCEGSDDTIDTDDEYLRHALLDNIDTADVALPNAPEHSSPSDDDQDAGVDKPPPPPAKFGFSSKLQEALLLERGQQQQQQQQQQQDGHLDLKILEVQSDYHLSICKCKDLTMEVHVTAYFNANLDLRTDQVVRIHPPWHELSRVGGLGRVILCTHNSEILPQKTVET